MPSGTHKHKRKHNTKEKKRNRHAAGSTSHHRRASRTESSPVLIVRPRGQAGRTDGGFNLQTEMKLSGNDELYRRIQHSVHYIAYSKLDMTKPYTRQHPRDVAVVIALVCDKHEPFLDKFENAWPVTDMLKMYLQNAKDRQKAPKSHRRLRKNLTRIPSSRSQTTTDSESDLDNGEHPDVEIAHNLEDSTSKRPTARHSNRDDNSHTVQQGTSVPAARHTTERIRPIKIPPYVKQKARRIVDSSDEESPETDTESHPVPLATRNTPVNDVQINVPPRLRRSGVQMEGSPTVSERDSVELEYANDPPETNLNTKFMKKIALAYDDFFRSMDLSPGRSRRMSEMMQRLREIAQVPELGAARNTVIPNYTGVDEAILSNRAGPRDDDQESPSPLPPATPATSDRTVPTAESQPNQPEQPRNLTAYDSFMRDLEMDEEEDRNATELEPTTCPQLGCAHAIPERPDAELTRLLSRRRDVLQKGKTRGAGGEIMILNTAICDRIAYHAQIDIARKEGWPSTIDPADLSQRVHALRTALRMVIKDPKVSYIWNYLKHKLSPQLTLADIAHLRETDPANPGLSTVRSLIHVGYYGEAGEAIIMSAVELMFPRWTLDEREIQPFSPSAFLEFILGPTAALRLISQDCDVDDAEAFRIMRKSTPYGYGRFRYGSDDSQSNIDSENPESAAVARVLRHNFLKLNVLRTAAQREVPSKGKEGAPGESAFNLGVGHSQEAGAPEKSTSAHGQAEGPQVAPAPKPTRRKAAARKENVPTQSKPDATQSTPSASVPLPQRETRRRKAPAARILTEDDFPPVRRPCVPPGCAFLLMHPKPPPPKKTKNASSTKGGLRKR
ncbi:hypothetical protein C8Q79DRAFT_963755 [Trametes meyenii]|nr:hypothetical protein C8Q79DRAFT_963755 [Trametes meyenii]